MKRIVVLVSALIFATSLTVFSQTQTTAAKKDQPRTTTTATMHQEPSRTAVHATATPSARSHTMITPNELPKEAQVYINKTYPGKKIEQAMKITDARGMVLYHAEVSGMMLRFDNNGKLLGENKLAMKPASGAKPVPTTTKSASTTEKKK